MGIYWIAGVQSDPRSRFISRKSKIVQLKLKLETNRKLKIESMWKLVLFLSILIVSLVGQNPFCPVGSTGGSVFSQKVQVGFGGQVSLIQGQDVQCYNYTLSRQFTSRPGIAIAVNSFECSQSADLYFSIKPVKNDLSGVIPFVIRTHWKYTQWSQIGFRFLVEDRPDLEANYYQLDSGWLSGCGNNKNVDMLVPIQGQFYTAMTSRVFLHGFQISTSTGGTSSPYQIQILNNQFNGTGILLSLSVTSRTQVHAIFMSYILYPTNSQSIIGGSFTLSNSLTSPVQSSAPNNAQYWLQFHGITGFIILQSSSFGTIKFGATWDTNQLGFNFTYGSNQYQYLGYHYVFFQGNQCGFCQGYPYLHSNQCVSICPQGTYQYNNQCIICQQGQYWNGVSCISCPTGQIYNQASQTCACPQGQYWTGYSCISCPNGQVYNYTSYSCQCPNGQFYNGFSCITCPAGQVYNQSTQTCGCSNGLYWNGNSCITCPAGQVYNQSTQNCGCSNGQYWNGYSCISCPQGQTYNPTTQTCGCPTGQYWNGYYCVACQTGQNNQNCGCSNGQYWNGYSCISCPQGQTYNPTTQTCGCPTGQYWNGYYCAPCQTGLNNQNCGCSNGQYWNGYTCISCPQGQTYNSTTQSCGCPSNQQWNGYQCVSCPVGQHYDQTKNSCSCPNNGYWNGFSCLQCSNGQQYNPLTNNCSCSSGLYWNGQQCIGCLNGLTWSPTNNRCECPQNQVWNGTSCSSCKGGQIINPYTQSCACPTGQSWNGYSCISCSAGRVYNFQTQQCDCPPGQFYDNLVCQSCPFGQNYNQQTRQCECPPGYVKNGTACIYQTQCPNTQIFNYTLGSCQCPSGLIWNGKICSQQCPTGQINLGNGCVCPQGTVWNGFSCATQQTCQSGFTWNGYQCVPQNQCPPGTIWDGSVCTIGGGSSCPSYTYWNGTACLNVTYNCPQGTQWNGYRCETIASGCPQGTYWDGYRCQLIPQNCPYGSTWNGTHCISGTGNCNQGTFWSGQGCSPVSCSNGQNYNPTTYQCECPIGQQWNGQSCVQCSGGRVWVLNQCVCQTGFWNGTACVTYNNNQCSNIPNSQWDGAQCACLPGFIQSGLSCVCNGLDYGTRCDLCYYKPNSQYLNGLCQCVNGFYDANGLCSRSGTGTPSGSPGTCNVANYYNTVERRCLRCTEGCLGCADSYTCQQCSIDFNYNSITRVCIEKCGDGKRYSLACDDGNNNDGDGCSRDCKVELGYTCLGGSPDNKDVCTSTKPSKLEIRQTGQTHTFGMITINVRLNYLPKNLIDSICQNGCKGVLKVQLVGGFKGASSIESIYTQGTTYSFAIKLDFGRQPIGQFDLKVSIDSQYSSYFLGVDITNSTTVSINPAYLALAGGNQMLGASDVLLSLKETDTLGSNLNDIASITTLNKQTEAPLKLTIATSNTTANQTKIGN